MRDFRSVRLDINLDQRRVLLQNTPHRTGVRIKPGTTFQNAVDLYVFDKKLRLLTLDALERIEIALRVDISHALGRHEKFAYLKPELFHDSFSTQLDGKTGLTKHHVWVGKHAALINRSKEDFIRHNKEKYRLGGLRGLGLRRVIYPLCGHD